MHVSVNGVRLFFDVEGAKLVPDGPAMREKPTCCCCMAAPASTIRSTGRPTPPSPTSRRSSTSTIAATAAARTARSELDSRAVGRRRARLLRRARHRRPDRARCVVRRHGRAGLRHPPSRAPLEAVLISTEAAGGSYRERRVALFERFGGPEVGALARRRFLEPEAPVDQAARDAWRKLALPVYTRIPRDPDMASRAINVRRWRCTGSPNRAARAHVQHVCGP